MGRLRVAILGHRPFVLKDGNGLVQILPADTAWALLQGDNPPTDWTTLSRTADGKPAWFPVKRIQRHLVRADLGFEDFVMPTAQCQALFVRDAAFRLRGEPCHSDTDPGHGLQQLRPLGGGMLQEKIDLEEEISQGMRKLGCALPFPTAEGVTDAHLRSKFGYMKLRFTRGSKELNALARITAAYVLSSRISPIPGRAVGARGMDKRRHISMTLICGSGRESTELINDLVDDMILLTRDSNHRNLPNAVESFNPSLIACMILLCGGGNHLRVPTFVLNGDDEVRNEFFGCLERLREKGRGSTSEGLGPVYEVSAGIAAGLSYMWGQRKRSRQHVFYSNAENFSSYHSRLQIALTEEDPFNRKLFPTGLKLQYGNGRQTYAFSIEAEGAAYFVDGVSRVVLRNTVDASRAKTVSPRRSGIWTGIPDPEANVDAIQ